MSGHRSYNTNSLILLIWNIIHIIITAWDNGDNDYLEDLMQWSKKTHEERASYHKKMSNSVRIRHVKSMICEISDAADYMPPE